MTATRISINVRLLIWTLLALVAAGGLVHLVHAMQWKRNSATLLAMADAAEAEGDKERTIRFLGQYVLRMPWDTETMSRFGFLLDEAGQAVASRRRARRVYEEVLIRDGERSDVRRRLALLDIALNDPDAARPHLESLLSNSPSDADLLFNLGLCQEAKREFSNAAESYKKSLEADPTRVSSYLRLALLQRDQLNQAEEANGRKADPDNQIEAIKGTINEMVEKNANSWQAFLARAEYRLSYRFGNPKERSAIVEQARKDIDSALKLAPDELTVLFTAAEFKLKFDESEGHLKKARDLFNRVRELNPRIAAVYEYLASVERKEHPDEPDKALEWLEKGLEKVPRPAALLWSLTHDLIVRGKLEQAEERLKTLATMEAELGGGRLDFLRAMMEMERGHWREAATTLEAARPYFARQNELTIDTDYLLARCYENLGSPQDSLVALGRILALDPLQQRARRAKAANLMRRDQVEDALREFEQLFRQDKQPPEVWSSAIQLMIAQTMSLPKGQRQWKPIDNLLAEFKKAAPESSQGTILEARILLAKDNPLDEARKLLRTARDSKPEDVDLWLALVGLEQRYGESGAAKTVLDDAEKRLGDRVAFRLARLSMALAKEKEPGAKLLQTFEKGIEDKKFSDADRVRLLSVLGDTARDLKLWSEARRLWGRVAALRPHDLAILLTLFELALQDSDVEGAKVALRKLQEQDGESGPVSQYAEARLYIWTAEQDHGEKDDRPGLAKARELLALAETRRPQWPQIAVARGRLEEIDEKPNLDLAISSYSRAIELGERNLATIRHLLELLYAKQDYQQANAVLRQLPTQLIVGGNLRQMAVDASLQVGDRSRALDLALRSVPDDSKDYRDHLWLGQVRAAAGQSTEAEGALRKAAGLAADKPEVWVALVQFYSQKDKVAEARKIIDEDVPKLKSQAVPTRARCFAALFQPKDPKRSAYKDLGRTAFQEALKADPKDRALLQSAGEYFLVSGDYREAEKRYGELLALQSEDATAAARTRRVLALVHLAIGTYPSLQAAVALLDKNVNDKKANPYDVLEDLRIQAIVRIRMPGKDDAGEAVRLLEEVDKKRELSAEDRFLLAQLYRRIGEQPKFEETMARILNENPRNTRFLAGRIRELVEKGGENLQEAEEMLRSMENTAPDDAAVMELKVRLLHAQGNQADARRTLDQWVNKKKGEDPKVLPAAAGLCEQLRQMQAAEQYFREYAKKEAEGILLLARFLGGQKGRLPEAIALCEQAWAKSPPDNVTAALMTILRAGTPTEVDLERAQAQLQAAAQKDPRPALLLSLAGIAELRGKYDDAEKIYVQVIAKDQNNPVALNNLAWLLALQNKAPDKAFELLKSALAQLGPIPELLDTRGMIYRTLGESKKAIADFREVTERPEAQPRLKATAWFHLALVYRQTNDEAAARSAFEESRKLGLTAEHLTPLERVSYNQLAAELHPTS
jgi:tetratricopeptide (TPR) repeat protein